MSNHASADLFYGVLVYDSDGIYHDYDHDSEPWFKDDKTLKSILVQMGKCDPSANEYVVEEQSRLELVFTGYEFNYVFLTIKSTHTRCSDYGFTQVSFNEPSKEDLSELQEIIDFMGLNGHRWMMAASYG